MLVHMCSERRAEGGRGSRSRRGMQAMRNGRQGFAPQQPFRVWGRAFLRPIGDFGEKHDAEQVPCQGDWVKELKSGCVHHQAASDTRS